MTRTTKPMAAGLCLFALVAPAAFGQPASRLEFEVASIKPSAPMTGGMMRIGMKVDAGRLDYANASLRDCIRTAYRVKDYQISWPDWLATARFDIVAKLPAGATQDQVPEMLQALLADRFKLTLHEESKEHGIYALVVGKNGPKLKESDPDSKLDLSVAPAPGGPSAGAVRQQMTFSSGGGEAGKGAPTGSTAIRVGPAGAQIDAKKVTLSALSDMLSRFVDLPVIDMTEIQGNYDFTLNVATEELMRGAKVMTGGAVMMGGPGGGGDGAKMPADAASDSGGGTIFQTVQQYWLKLEKRKAAMKTVIVDSAEKLPTEN